MDRNEILDGVRACVAESLAVPEENIQESSRLIGDLGADSLDFLDIVFGLETAFSIKLRDPTLDMVTRGDVPEGAGPYLSAEDLDRLGEWLPALRSETNRDRVTARSLYSYITVESLALMVERKLAEEGQ